MKPLAALLLTATALALSPGVASAQDVIVRGLEDNNDLDWSYFTSDVPTVDLSGEWRFVAAESDPMVEPWAGREIVYVIAQTMQRVLLEFRPDNGEPTKHDYSWNGSVAASRRADAEVRERARWTDSGRTLEIEGRWWTVDARNTVYRYTNSYSLRGERRLVFVQRDDHGTTTWIFQR